LCGRNPCATDKTLTEEQKNMTLTSFMSIGELNTFTIRLLLIGSNAV